MLLAYGLTGLTRKYALRKELLDIPNQRSSHSVPTPRGGGVSIVIIIVLTSMLAAWRYPDQAGPLLLLSTTSFFYAMLGWLDDHVDLSSLSRFLVQILIAVAAVSWLLMTEGRSSTVNIPVEMLAVAAVLWVVWMANLYNFMDGIDGIAAIQALVLSAVAAAWFGVQGATGIMILTLSVAGASVGFLGWNWSPARIFMGDVGSVALGAFFAALALVGSSLYDIPMTAFIVLYGVFLADATLTLIKRMLRREKWWQAHRSHYYQRAVQSGWSHAQVSLAVLQLNVVLAALATALIAGILSEAVTVLLACVILAGAIILINLRCKKSQSDGAHH
jgi:Fuc2NAc and GlcNAc transferase